MNNIKKFCQKSIVHSDVNNNASYDSFCCDSFCYKIYDGNYNFCSEDTEKIWKLGWQETEFYSGRFLFSAGSFGGGHQLHGPAYCERHKSFFFYPLVGTSSSFQIPSAYIHKPPWPN